MEKKYIQPSIINYSLFRTLLDEKATLRYFGISKGAELSLNDISSKKSTRTFVIAEPGFGKTRLLKEIISYASVISKEGIFIELKKILPNRAIDAYIQDNLAVLFKSKKFILKNSKQLVVCLDALDEVKSYDFSAIVELIEVFSKKYFNISLFVSCRYHHFSKYQNLFDTFQFDFLQIQPFTREQVKSYLNNSNISDQDVEQMIRILTSRGRDLIIQTPRYLEMIANFIGKEGAEVVSNLTKGELFEKFIYQKLDLENRKSKNNESELIKRVLEKIALVMEIYQTNTLKKDDLITIFEDVKSNLNISFLHQVPIKDFLDRTVIKDNIDEIEFENTEFQEFLAAKEILRLGRSDQVVFDLAVDQELNEIFPSWFNTLSFLIDLNIDLINPIFEFTNNRLSDLQDEAYHRFLTRVHVERLKLEERKRIFEDVFSYYQKAMNWIPYDVAENLSFYFDISQNIILKKAIVEAESEPNYFVKNGNVAFIIAFLIEKEIFNDSQLKYWEEKLTQFAKDANTNGVLQRQTLFALGKLKNIELLKKVVHLRTSSDDLILQEFMEACAEINPNDKFSIDSFVIGCKRREIYARYGIYQITERKGLKQLLDYFVSDDKFLDMFFDQESIFKEKDKKLIENIKNRFDKNIQKS
ncbi:MAG: hypothetical protein KJ736_09480, partial [Candidatus Omnitrophica bacterium]|nr:hypothetical protein [Candidatus Omnitrophota bacterium]